jgi:chemotaxis protein MotB
LARRKTQDEAGGTSSFTVMFTSLSIILLAFFILLNSMATIEEVRVKEALGSITRVFSGFGAGPIFPRADSLVAIGENLAFVAEGPGRELKKKVEEMLKGEGMDEEIELVEDGEDILLVFPSYLLFDSGQAYLKPHMNEILKVVAGFIKASGYVVTVEGHTDNVPIHSALFPSNWELSTARAGAVVRRLLELHGINPKKVAGIGFAEFRPVVPNDTPENRAKNRRVALRFEGMALKEGEFAEPAAPTDPVKPDLGI